MPERNAGLQGAAGDLPGERFIAAVEAGAHQQRRVAPGDGAEDAGKLLRGEKAVVGARRTEGHVVVVLRVVHHLGGEIVHPDVGGLGHGLGHAGLGGQAGRTRPHIITGLWPGLEEAAVFEHSVGLEHRGDTHIALPRHDPDRRHPVARTQRALLNEVLERVGQLDVERPGAVRGGGPG